MSQIINVFPNPQLVHTGTVPVPNNGNYTWGDNSVTFTKTGEDSYLMWKINVTPNVEYYTRAVFTQKNTKGVASVWSSDWKWLATINTGADGSGTAVFTAPATGQIYWRISPSPNGVTLLANPLICRSSEKPYLDEINVKTFNGDTMPLN